MIRIDPSHLAVLVGCAVRYALGRRSYAVGEVAELLCAHAGALPFQDVERLRGEIERELAACEARGTWCGDRQDHETWRRAVRHLDPADRREVVRLLASGAALAHGEEPAPAWREVAELL